MHRYTFKCIFYSSIAIQSATSAELSNRDKIIIETAKSHEDICNDGATSNGGTSIDRQIEITKTGSYTQDGKLAGETYAHKDVKNYGNFTVISEKCSEFNEGIDTGWGRKIGAKAGGESLATFKILSSFFNYKNTYIKKFGELILGRNAQYINKRETTVTDYAKIKINGGKYINTGQTNIIGNGWHKDAGYAEIYAGGKSNIENNGILTFKNAKFQLNDSKVIEKGITLFDEDSLLRLNYSSYELSSDAYVAFKDNAQISFFGSQIIVKDNATIDFSGLKTGKIYNCVEEDLYVKHKSKKSSTKNNSITFKNNTKILIPHISFKETNKNILNIQNRQSYEVMQPTSLIIPKYILNKAQTTIHEANQKEDIKQKLIETIINEFKITLTAQIQHITFEPNVEEPIKKSYEDELCILKLTKEVFEKANVTPEDANKETNKQILLETINNEYNYDELTVDDKKIKFELYEDKECKFVRSETIKKFQPTLEGTVTVGLSRSLFDVAKLTVEQANSSQENKAKLFKTIEEETGIEFLGDTCKAKFEQYDSETEECVDYWSNEECD